ncbi:MAG: hypothetical protein JXR07_11580 [Reichenbachiella sp.]
MLKFPKLYPDSVKIESFFKEMSFAYKVELDNELALPMIVEGKKIHEGESAINALINDLNGFYGEHYNCSCAR